MKTMIIILRNDDDNDKHDDHNANDHNDRDHQDLTLYGLYLSPQEQKKLTNIQVNFQIGNFPFQLIPFLEGSSYFQGT